MTRVIPIEEVRYTPAVAVLECGEEAPISFYVTEFGRGEGTPLHLHPYPEVFLVERNAAVFTSGDHEMTVTEGHYVIVPANTPHRYVGASDEPGSRRQRPAERQGQADKPLTVPSARPRRRQMEDTAKRLPNTARGSFASV